MIVLQFSIKNSMSLNEKFETVRAKFPFILKIAYFSCISSLLETFKENTGNRQREGKEEKKTQLYKL
jgi:hypothetical protein